MIRGYKERVKIKQPTKIYVHLIDILCETMQLYNECVVRDVWLLVNNILYLMFSHFNFYLEN